MKKLDPQLQMLKQTFKNQTVNIDLLMYQLCKKWEDPPSRDFLVQQLSKLTPFELFQNLPQLW